jgi:hypothetical protein
MVHKHIDSEGNGLGLSDYVWKGKNVDSCTRRVERFMKVNGKDAVVYQNSGWDYCSDITLAYRNNSYRMKVAMQA